MSALVYQVEQRCQFPNCSYSTKIKSFLCEHHIYNRDWPTITLCPNHHVRIYRPWDRTGIHSCETKESIIILPTYSFSYIQCKKLKKDECDAITVYSSNDNTMKLVSISYHDSTWLRIHMSYLRSNNPEWKHSWVEMNNIFSKYDIY